MQDSASEQPVYIDTNEQLAQCCQQWSQQAILALDTEFIRTDTYYPIGALIQLSDGEHNYLIDPLQIDQFDDFKAILVNPQIVKVLHSCSEDLEVFYRLFGVLPAPIFDTQIAAGMDGYGFSLGYQALTEVMLSLHVPKGETRSNWLQRPLTDSQIHYAALDVEYLPEIYSLLSQSLQGKGRLHWVQQDCARMVNDFTDLDGIADYYKKVKTAWKLSPPQLAVLQKITQWREYKARELDRPRGRVLKDRSCFEIARLQPDTIEGLAAIDEIGPKLVRTQGETLLQLIKDAQQLSASEHPPRMPKPLPPETGSILKRLKAHVKKLAEQLQLAPELLVRKRDYEALLRSGFDQQPFQLPPTLNDWRKEVVGNDLLHMVSRKA
jgi:ribonuclease D